MAFIRITRAGMPVRLPLLCDPTLQKYLRETPVKAAEAASKKSLANHKGDASKAQEKAAEAFSKAYKTADEECTKRIELFEDSLDVNHLAVPKEILDQCTYVTIKALDGKERHEAIVSTVLNSPSAASNNVKFDLEYKLEIARRCLLSIDGSDAKQVKDTDGVLRFPLEELTCIREYGSIITEIGLRLETVSTLGEPPASL